MRILHLFADWKWTGPAQPVLQLCGALRARGLDATLACMAAPSQEGRTLPGEAVRAGVCPATHLGFRAGLLPLDVVRAARWIDAERFDIVHVHTSADHLVGALAARASRRRPRVVRTNHTDSALSAKFLQRAALPELTDGYLCHSRRILDRESGIPEERRAAVDPALPVEAYPALASTDDIRRCHGLDPGDFVFGMVLRIQAHRRFDVVLEGVDRALRRGARFKVLVLGRGTRRDELAVLPARERGLDGAIRFAGYVEEEYLQTLACFDAMIYLRTGSDGTARALREVQTVGRPAVVSDHGLLPDLVEEGRTGWIIPLDAEALAQALERAAADPPRAREMGRAARETALRRYDLGRAADFVEGFYRRLREE